MTEIVVPDKLYKLAEKKAKEFGFDSADEYIKFIIEEMVADDSDNERVKTRLKGLGYL